MSGFKQVTKAQARRSVTQDARFDRLEDTPAQLESRDEYVREIASLWRNAQEKFLLIGRYLVVARAKLPHGDYQTMVESELPFGYQVSYQLRVVAEAIDSGKLLGERMPLSYATVYQLATLTDANLKLAEQSNLIRPDVTRPEITEFKRRLRQTALAGDEQIVALARDKERLIAQRERIQTQIEAIERQIRELSERRVTIDVDEPVAD
ncbi:MAG: hypothetical protein WCF85_04395 [Rhodospirillaceae bacterium]